MRNPMSEHPLVVDRVADPTGPSKPELNFVTLPLPGPRVHDKGQLP